MTSRDADFLYYLIECSKPSNTTGIAVSSSEGKILKFGKVQQLIHVHTGEPGWNPGLSDSGPHSLLSL